MTYATSWVGSTFGGSGDTTTPGGEQKHIPIDIDTMFVASDGTVYTNAGYDEGSGEESVLNSAGDLLGRSDYATYSTTGWAVTANANYFFNSNDDGQSHGLALYNPVVSGGRYNRYNFSSGIYGNGSHPGPNISVAGSSQPERYFSDGYEAYRTLLYRQGQHAVAPGKS